jgi:hypothetical protein
MPSQQCLELGQVSCHWFGRSLESAADFDLQVFLVADWKVEQAKVCHKPFPVTPPLTIVSEPGGGFPL